MFKKSTTIRRFLALMAALMLTCGAIGTAQAAYVIKQTNARMAGVAGEALTTGQVVCIKASDGLVYKAVAGTSTLRPALGIVGKGGATGANVEIITSGVVSGWSSLTKGAYGYLSDTAGAISQTGAGWLQPVAVAVSATAYKVNFEPYGGIDLVSGVSHSYGAAAVDWTLTADESRATYIAATSASGAVNALLPAATAGKLHFIYNNTGQVLTFKVTGQTGGTVANGKYALYIDNGTDVKELYEQP